MPPSLLRKQVFWEMTKFSSHFYWLSCWKYVISHLKCILWILWIISRIVRHADCTTIRRRRHFLSQPTSSHLTNVLIMPKNARVFLITPKRPLWCTEYMHYVFAVQHKRLIQLIDHCHFHWLRVTVLTREESCTHVYLSDENNHYSEDFRPSCGRKICVIFEPTDLPRGTTLPYCGIVQSHKAVSSKHRICRENAECSKARNRTPSPALIMQYSCLSVCSVFGNYCSALPSKNGTYFSPIRRVSFSQRS